MEKNSDLYDIIVKNHYKESFMNLYISGSNRKHNSYNFLNKLKNEDDILYPLQDLDIKYCLGCNCCIKR